jgi:lipoprotein NlpI
MRHWFWIVVAGLLIGQSDLAMASGNGDSLECFAAYFQHDYDTALALCNRALQSGDLSNQQFVNTLNYRGGVYVGKGDYDKAVEDYDQAIRLKPDDASTYNNRGIAYSHKGEYDRAIQDFDQAIRLKPDDDSAYVGRASAYANRGEYDQAIQSFDQAIRLDPDSTYAPLWRAQLLFELARFSDAGDALEKLINANPQIAEGVLWLALARWRAGESVNDKPTAQAQALDLEKWPGPVVRLYLGQISRDAVQAAAGDPDPKIAKRQSCEAAFYIAELDLVSGQAEAAKPGFHHVIDICPKFYRVARVAKAELGRM